MNINDLAIFFRTGKTKTERIEKGKELKEQLNEYLNSDSRILRNHEGINLIHYEKLINGVNTPYFIEIINPDQTEKLNYHLFLKLPMTDEFELNYHSVVGKMFFEIKKISNIKFIHIGELCIIHSYARGYGFSRDLLAITLKFAKNNQCQFISGNVTYDDLKHNKFILTYCIKLGFKIIEECEWGLKLKLKVTN